MNEAKRNERRLDRLVRWLFGHRHKWEPYRLLGNKGRMVFYCRECECGKKQIQQAGPMGDGKWQDLVPVMNLTNDFENDWLRGAVRLPPNTEVRAQSTGEEAMRIPTRPRCHRCQRYITIDTDADDDLWHEVIGPTHGPGYICADCFTRAADERLIRWEGRLRLVPYSLARQMDIQADAAGMRSNG